MSFCVKVHMWIMWILCKKGARIMESYKNMNVGIDRDVDYSTRSISVIKIEGVAILLLNIPLPSKP